MGWIYFIYSVKFINCFEQDNGLKQNKNIKRIKIKKDK